MIENEQLLRTPLYQSHIDLKARMVPFGGWEMPVQYDGILMEHAHTRKAAAIFDISHMGEFLIEGDLKDSGLDRILTMRLDDLPIKASRYGCICNENGGVIDDCIVFRLEKNKWFVVVNGATIEKDAQHFKTYLTDTAKFINLSMALGKIDIQGPLSRDVLKQLIPDVERLKYFQFDRFNLLGEDDVLISRTGYTGELGYEIFFPWDKTENLWKKLLSDDRVMPAGLGARDILRLEMGYSLYGHELNDTLTPLESGLKRFVCFEKDFIGKLNIAQQLESGCENQIVGFISESRRSPRAEQKIYDNSEKEIGWVSSGCFSPQLEKGIGLGFVKKEFSVKGTQLLFGSAKNKVPALVQGRNFYKSESIKS